MTIDLSSNEINTFRVTPANGDIVVDFVNGSELYKAQNVKIAGVRPDGLGFSLNGIENNSSFVFTSPALITFYGDTDVIIMCDDIIKIGVIHCDPDTE